MDREEILGDLRERIASIGPDTASVWRASSDASLSHDHARPVERQVPPSEPNAAPTSPDDGKQGDSKLAFRKIVDLLNASDKSERSLRERLERHGYASEAIDAAIDRAKDYGYIDDLRFADVLIRSRISQGKGSAGIERELASNGIDPGDVEGWPFEYGIDHDAELERALEALRRKPPRSKNRREGAFRRLVQRGFPTSVASSAARIWQEELDG